MTQATFVCPHMCKATWPGQRGDSWTGQLSSRCIKMHLANSKKKKKKNTNAWNYRSFFSHFSANSTAERWMTLAYWIVTVLSSKLMGGEKRTFPKRSAWGKKLIKALVFQPEQDRTNQSLRRSPLHLESGHRCFSQVAFVSDKEARETSDGPETPPPAPAEAGGPVCGREAQTLLLCHFSTKLTSEAFVLPPLPQDPCVTQHLMG